MADTTSQQIAEALQFAQQQGDEAVAALFEMLTPQAQPPYTPPEGTFIPEGFSRPVAIPPSGPEPRRANEAELAQLERLNEAGAEGFDFLKSIFFPNAALSAAQSVGLVDPARRIPFIAPERNVFQHLAGLPDILKSALDVAAPVPEEPELVGPEPGMPEPAGAAMSNLEDARSRAQALLERSGSGTRVFSAVGDAAEASPIVEAGKGFSTEFTEPGGKGTFSKTATPERYTKALASVTGLDILRGRMDAAARRFAKEPSAENLKRYEVAQRQHESLREQQSAEERSQLTEQQLGEQTARTTSVTKQLREGELSERIMEALAYGRYDEVSRLLGLNPGEKLTSADLKAILEAKNVPITEKQFLPKKIGGLEKYLKRGGG